MASAWNRFFASKRKAGHSAKAIGRMWRTGKSGQTAHRKSTKRRARRNTRGVPLTGKTYRPKLPTSGGVVVVQQAAGESFKKASRKKASHKRKASRRKAAAPHKRRKSRKKSRKGGKAKAHKNRAVRHARRGRKGGRRRRAHRNAFGGGIMGALKSIVMRPLSKDTLRLAGAVLAGAVVATGAPSLMPSYNTGWMGLALSVLAAGAAGALAQRFMPAAAGGVVAGGLVVVGLRLVAQFAPSALRWSASPAAVAAGFSRPGGGNALRGFSRPGGGNALAGLGAAASQLTGSSTRGLVSAGRETFRAKKFA